MKPLLIIDLLNEIGKPGYHVFKGLIFTEEVMPMKINGGGGGGKKPDYERVQREDGQGKSWDADSGPG